MDKNLKLILQSAEVQRMLTAAKSFINLIEREDIQLDQLIFESRVCLTELYAAGLDYPPIPLVHSTNTGGKLKVTREELTKSNQNLIKNVKDAGLYWEVFDPIYEKNESPTQGWLVDDFGDVFADLKTELYKIEVLSTDAAIEDGLWSLGFGFKSHWGHHCINALRALHYVAR